MSSRQTPSSASVAAIFNCSSRRGLRTTLRRLGTSNLTDIGKIAGAWLCVDRPKLTEGSAVLALWKTTPSYQSFGPRPRRTQKKRGRPGSGEGLTRALRFRVACKSSLDRSKQCRPPGSDRHWCNHVVGLGRGRAVRTCVDFDELGRDTSSAARARCSSFPSSPSIFSSPAASIRFPKQNVV